MVSTEVLKKDIVLENNRVLLTPMTQDHYSELSKIAFDPSLWEIAITLIKTGADLKQYIEIALNEKKAGLAYPFVIMDKVSGNIAGSTRYGSISHEHKRLEIGWTWLAKNHQGTGLNKACKYELLKFAFEGLDFNRVELKTDFINQQSRKAIRKIGAKEEGVFRSHCITPNRRIRDTVYYSIIKSEWEGIKKNIFLEFVN